GEQQVRRPARQRGLDVGDLRAVSAEEAMRTELVELAGLALRLFWRFSKLVLVDVSERIRIDLREDAVDLVCIESRRTQVCVLGSQIPENVGQEFIVPGSQLRELVVGERELLRLGLGEIEE